MAFMDTKELKSLYYGKLAVDPDSPVWEEFEYLDLEYLDFEGWIRFDCPIHHSMFDTLKIRHNPTPKNWQPAGGNWYISLLCNNVSEGEHKQHAKECGLTRTNKEQAEQDLAQIRQFCRFLAWRAENCCYTDILPVLDYAGCFLGFDDYDNLRMLINSGEVEL